MTGITVAELFRQDRRQTGMAAWQIQPLHQGWPPALEYLHLHAGRCGGIPRQGQPLHLQPQQGR